MVRMIQLNLKGGTVIQMEKWAEAAVAQLVECECVLKGSVYVLTISCLL